MQMQNSGFRIRFSFYASRPQLASGAVERHIEATISVKLNRKSGCPSRAPNFSYITNDFGPVARLLAMHLRTSGGVLTNKHEYTYNALKMIPWPRNPVCGFL